MPETNLPAEGRIGVPPPADAPREVSQPLSPAALSEMQSRARQNERELAPLRPVGGAPIDAPGASGEVLAPLPVQPAPGYVQTVPKTEYPAASNSESPTRGLPGTAPIPAARSTVPIGISGGFGSAGDAEYFPLDGREALTLAMQLFDELSARLQNDLRFSMAVTYPRLSMKLQLVIEGEADDQAFTIEKVLPPHGKWDRTPIEVAKQNGDSVVFVVTALRREFDEEGNVQTPADGMRDELGLRKPRKHSVGSGIGKSIVDVEW